MAQGRLISTCSLGHNGDEDAEASSRCRWRWPWWRRSCLPRQPAPGEAQGPSNAFGSQPNAADLSVSLPPSPTAEMLQRLVQIDGVAVAAVQPMLWVRPLGSDLYPGLNLYPVVLSPQGSTAPNRPIVVEGRLPDGAAVTLLAVLLIGALAAVRALHLQSTPLKPE